MNQTEFNRRTFMALFGASAAASAFGVPARAQEALKLWAPGIAKVGAQDWSDMESQSGVGINAIAKSARADESIQKMVVGDGNALYDAMTDNGGGMEDALASQGAIAELDPARIPNWANILPHYQEGGAAADTLRHDGKLYAIPYISNADSLAFNFDEIGEELTSWEALFDSQFRGRAAMQNDFGPTLTNTAIYLKQSGKGSIDNPSDMTEDEVRQTCEFLIDLKKKGHFRTFWDGVQNGADLLSSEEVLVSSCWEVIQIFAARKNGQDIRYGTMKEGHQTWNNIVMLTRGGKERGMEDAFYALANVYLSPWFGARTLAGLGFSPQMSGVNEYVDANPDDFDADTKAIMAERLARKQARRSVAGNSWQNVFPTNMRAYQDWWAKVQAA
ncbi:ABC transporter substrate-binding protein [Lutimaribacter sp. EGI FJ00015]|uniref:ABC transporter substrate-binding protein n=1 Tax=Lutimaribacter degradans TaxID=2945989 RepID=A0ACC5ZZ01_9RHOB|nr:ABC transporter substrate-binding protein [Lutimaribacter sp. EGI FJ00013]MCM2562971.1 ABC transporter substrate-binding protein [Lutimaribacter sp. EGI FJ00013]MCO0614139.1 ABC transporter substrate-binding protein [Lutimaribacter sp. EGI FJ00015]MCO0636116.1 ABC transporter substrate-binding protein [Lutimaribacter sp. EGI FJ00014]